MATACILLKGHSIDTTIKIPKAKAKINEDKVLIVTRDGGPDDGEVLGSFGDIAGFWHEA